MNKFVLNMDISENMRRLREKNMMTQADVTKKLQLLGSNIEATTYNKIENGHRNIRNSDFVLLKFIFKANYEDFFDGLIPPELEELLREYDLME